MGRVEGKTILITGAASGIGKAGACLLAREGAEIMMTDLDEMGHEVATAICENGGKATFVKQDVARETSWQEIFEEVDRRFGRLDVLINNAGIAVRGNIENLGFDEWIRTMRVNLDSVFLGTRAAVRFMKEKGGSIINIGSVSGIAGLPDLAGYSSSKGGVRMLTKSAALHCAREGYKIRVNSIHPGYIETDMVRNNLNRLANSDEVRKAIEDMHPVGHMGEPDDIAQGMLYLASDDSKFMTGSDLVIDGGFTAR